MKKLVFILVLIIFSNICYAQITDKKRQKTRTTEQAVKQQTTIKQQTISNPQQLVNKKVIIPAKSPEEIARIKAFNWIAPFKNYGNFYTPETIKNLSNLDLSTGSPTINGVSRTYYMADDSLIHLRQFTGLKLLVATTWMTNKGLDHIGTLQNITGLYLGETNITDAGLSKIANMPLLETLVLFDTPITNNGLQQIVQEHPGLRILNIGNTGINDAGMVHIPNLTYLENLILTRGNFTDISIPYILQLNYLKLISVEFTQISQAGKDQLRAAFPNATIID